MNIEIAAILDYIMTTPENFNPNIFREFLTDPVARENLVMTYFEKNTLEGRIIIRETWNSLPNRT